MNPRVYMMFVGHPDTLESSIFGAPHAPHGRPRRAPSPSKPRLCGGFGQRGRHGRVCGRCAEPRSFHLLWVGGLSGGFGAGFWAGPTDRRSQKQRENAHVHVHVT